MSHRRQVQQQPCRTWCLRTLLDRASQSTLALLTGKLCRAHLSNLPVRSSRSGHRPHGRSPFVIFNGQAGRCFRCYYASCFLASCCCHVRRRGSVTLRNLTECSVYILDHSSYLSVSDCTDCQIFVGASRSPAALLRSTVRLLWAIWPASFQCMSHPFPGSSCCKPPTTFRSCRYWGMESDIAVLQGRWAASRCSRV